MHAFNSRSERQISVDMNNCLNHSKLGGWDKMNEIDHQKKTFKITIYLLAILCKTTLKNKYIYSFYM